MDVMGGTLEEIAFEKSGVIKSGIPCVIGPTCLNKQPIIDYAKSQNSELIMVPEKITHEHVNNQIVNEILKVVCKKENVPFDYRNFVKSVSQPCRFERIKNVQQKIVMDVCHNYQGIQSVLNKINVEYPEVKNIKIAFVISKKKKLDDVIDLFNENPKIKDVHVISRPHMRLMSAE